MMRADKLSPAAECELERIDRHSTSGPWWHDLAPGTREALLRLGLIEDDGTHTGCGTHGLTGPAGHPGYVVLTATGREALREHEERRRARRDFALHTAGNANRRST